MQLERPAVQEQRFGPLAAQDEPRRPGHPPAERPDQPATRHAEVRADDDAPVEAQDEVLAVHVDRGEALSVDVLGDPGRPAAQARRRRLDHVADERLQPPARAVDGVALGHVANGNAHGFEC